MPELPEVERARRVCERVAAGRRIVDVWCDDDPIVFDGVEPSEVAARLIGRRVEVVARRGKYFWWRLDRGPHPLFHLGMTGHVREPEGPPLRLATDARRQEDAWPPRFTKLRVKLEGGRQLAVTNARRLGRIRLRADPEEEPPVASLGFDPLLEMPSPREFLLRWRRRRGVVKSLLLDQTWAAGIGNWIADEVLYQAKIDPRRRAHDLADDEVARIRSRLGHVIRRACHVDADSDRFPRGWLFHVRWGRSSAARTAAGDAVEFVDIGGRTTAWVPAVQR